MHARRGRLVKVSVACVRPHTSKKSKSSGKDLEDRRGRQLCQRYAFLLSRAEVKAMLIPPIREERENEACQNCDTKIMFTICAQLIAIVRKPMGPQPVVRDPRVEKEPCLKVSKMKLKNVWLSIQRHKV